MKFFLFALMFMIAGCNQDVGGCESPYTFKKIGELPSKIHENSGMAYSVKYKRLYTIQDSGNAAVVWVTDLTGKLLGKIKVPTHNEDWEALSLGPCAEGTCLFIGDIGDNSDDRDYVRLISFKEPASLLDKVSIKIRKITYEGGSINAEGLSVHPKTGAIYIASKNYDNDSHVIYKLDGNKAKKHLTVKIKDPIGGMSISPSGAKFVLTTTDTGRFYESDWQGNLMEIKVKRLGQEESVAHIGENVFVYATEGGRDLIEATKKVN